MLEMIAAGVEGTYVFHRAEERGGLGSYHVSIYEPELLEGIEVAIAFDRKGTSSVITHQLGERCCSERFARGLAAQLAPLPYQADATGVFTDTANYMYQVSECTNISVGYYNEHGPRETLDLVHLKALRDVMCEQFDPRALRAYRDTEAIPVREA